MDCVISLLARRTYTRAGLRRLYADLPVYEVHFLPHFRRLRQYCSKTTALSPEVLKRILYSAEQKPTQRAGTIPFSGPGETVSRYSANSVSMAAAVSAYALHQYGENGHCRRGRLNNAWANSGGFHADHVVIRALSMATGNSFHVPLPLRTLSTSCS